MAKTISLKKNGKGISLSQLRRWYFEKRCAITGKEEGGKVKLRKARVKFVRPDGMEYEQPALLIATTVRKGTKNSDGHKVISKEWL